LGIFIGVITFIGSVIAFLKLDGKISGNPLIIGGWFRHVINLFLVGGCVVLWAFYLMHNWLGYLFIMTALALLLGFHLIMAIGGADMPVVVSMLNSYSGWVTAVNGLLLNNALLIITGALVGSSGAILSYIMCVYMNRSFFGVIMGGFGMAAPVQMASSGVEPIAATVKDFIKDLHAAKSVIIVPGYGMAASKCAVEVGRFAETLRKLGKRCRFCIHPVAGRLPGHMNVLLAEANVPHKIVEELDEINPDFDDTDVVIVIGANDTVNPDAERNPNSAIKGMPVCQVWHAKKSFH